MGLWCNTQRKTVKKTQVGNQRNYPQPSLIQKNALKNGGWETTFLLGWHIFRYFQGQNVSFRECKWTHIGTWIKLSKVWQLVEDVFCFGLYLQLRAHPKLLVFPSHSIVNVLGLLNKTQWATKNMLRDLFLESDLKMVAFEESGILFHVSPCSSSSLAQKTRGV